MSKERARTGRKPRSLAPGRREEAVGGRPKKYLARLASRYDR